MANTFPCIAVMELEAVSFIAGTNQVWTYNVYDDSGSTVDISACATYLTLSPYGDPDYVAMSVAGTLSGSSIPYQFIVTTGSASRSLSGKYVQQAVVVDFTGEEYRAGQGECTIRPRIATEEVVSDESLPSSLVLNFSGMSDGAVPTLSGSTWSVSSGCVINVPSTGSELLTDGGLEIWSGASTLTSWTEFVSGSSTINRESSIVHSGSYSARLDVDASGNAVLIQQSISNSLYDWLYISGWAYSSSLGKQSQMSENNAQQVISMNPGTTWTQYIWSVQASKDDTDFQFKRAAGASSSGSLYGDDFSIKVTVLSSMLAVNQFSTSYGILKAAWSITSGVQAGIIMCLDDPANPQNMITCYHNRTNLIFSKRVAGVVTTLISTTATYVAGANVEIRRVWGTNVFRAYYNGSQVGTDQTISDSTIINNKYHGLFSTDSQNKCSSFSFYGV